MNIFDDFDFILNDRIAKIREINKQYDLENNAYISFSGGKDSTILHYLIDMALPNNHIPRIYANTGIEYKYIVDFVKDLRNNDERFIILNQTRNIKKTLDVYGYPFKSKEHSLRVQLFNNGSSSFSLKKYISGYNKDNSLTAFRCPNILLYQFTERGKYNYSNKCCYKLKKDLIENYIKHLKSICITGMRSEEGGNRSRLGCTIFSNGKLLKFHPLIVVNNDFENWFLKKFSIKLCVLYYPPYNFKRTGCVGCPFSLTLNDDLKTMKKLLPIEYKKANILWRYVYDEYKRIGYRLSNMEEVQLSIYDIDSSL